MQRRRTHLFRTLIAVMAILSGFVAAAAWVINRPEAVRHALAIATFGSGWRVELGKFEWRPLASEIAIDGVSADNPAKGKSLRADRIRISYMPLGLVRGKLVIDELLVDGADISLPGAGVSPPGRERRRLGLANLILLKNLELKDARVKGLSIAFGEGSLFTADEARVSMAPKFFGDTSLSIHTSGLSLARAESQIVSAGAMSLSASTDLGRWGEAFPYLGDIDGRLRLSDVAYQGLVAEDIGASLSFADGAVDLKDLAITIDQKKLAARLSATLADESFDLEIDVQKPIALPYIGRRMETIDTAGAISGSLKLKGKGLSLPESAGSGRIEASYLFDVSPDAPVSVAADLAWKGGTVKIREALVRAGEDVFTAEGAIDIPGRQFKFSAGGSHFPIEHVFNKFRNPHLAKIFGPTDFKGQVEGWGKKFIAKVAGTTFGGGWKPITAQRAETQLEVTYDYVKLNGLIFSGARQTGRADLSVKLGPKMEGMSRSKFIDLDATLSDHPLAESLAVFGLEGNGAGNVRIRGPHTSFSGDAVLKVEDGRWHSLPFESASSRLAISRRQIKFTDMALKLPKIDEPRIAGQLQGDIGEGKFRLHGTPVEGLDLDGTYRYADGRWLISKVAWADPSNSSNSIRASGSASSGGPMDLKVLGKLDLESLASMAPLVRSGSGVVDIDMAIRGTGGNPWPSGRIAFHDNALSPRGVRLGLENLNGALAFDGPRISFDGISAAVDEGDLRLSGYIEHRNFGLAAANLALDASAMRYRSEDGALSLEFDGNLSLVGAFPSPLLKGEVKILDGRYTKDFTIIDALSGGGRKGRKIERERGMAFNPRLALHVRNAGDLAIRNNVGDIWLNVNADIRGTRKEPVMAGSIDTADGRVHYLGMEFDITKGFMEFRERYAVPYLEVYAQRELGVYNINLTLHGHTDNLALDLSATSPSGPLEKRDVVSLIMFGTTEQERAAVARQAGGTLAGSLVGQAVTGVLERPVQKITHLDVFRLEAGAAASGAPGISRVLIGKRISDRLTVNFATDINTTSAVQTMVGEYQVTDNLVVSGSRSSDSNYKISGALRFRLR